MELQNQNNRIPSRLTDGIYIGILVCLFAGFVMLFYRQCIRYNGGYISDTIVYAQDMGDLVHSRMMAFILPWFYRLTGDYYVTAVFLSLIIIATIIASYMLISYLLERENVAAERWQIQAMSLASLVATAIYIPGIYEHFYMETWTRYSWQSPTQQAMILFSLLSLLMFFRVYDSYMESIKPGQWTGLAVLLFLTAWAKPNFMMVFAPVVIIVFIADLVRRKDYSVGHRLSRIVMLGMAFVPAGIFILVLNHLEGSVNDHSEIVIRPFFFLEEISCVPLMIFCSLAFPLVVFAVNYRKLRDIYYRIICGMTLFGIGEYLLLAESGWKIDHGNFGWGREVAEYILFLAALVLALKNYRDKAFLADRPVMRKVYLAAIAVLLAGHIITGIVYLQLVARGHKYRI
ncbi:MAG: hypothetical protein MJ161_01445 [Clostridia bacterium]|nr:hypothetical protein [Clostridia bacterium]